MLTGEDVSNVLREFVKDGSSCGFMVYALMNADNNHNDVFIEEMDFEENFKDKIRNNLLEVIEEKYLSGGIEYSSGAMVADNQKKMYIIPQNEAYHPFALLNNNIENTQNFKFEGISKVKGICFMFRYKGRIVWGYQHMWSIMVPNKSKSNILVRVLKQENHDIFEQQKEDVLTILNKLDLVIVEDCIVTDNIGLLQTHFDFHNFVQNTAAQCADKISQKEIVLNPDKITDYINRDTNKSKYARKLMRISDSAVFDLSPEQLMEKVHTVKHWQGVFEEQDGKIILNTYKQVEDLIDLFDERFVRSDVTDAEYDTDVKRKALPMGSS